MMAVTSQTNTIRESYEYVVYTFQRCDKKQQEKWQLQDSFEDQQEALSVARNLFDSGAFCRVEVKEKYTNIAVGHISDTTLKVFEQRNRMPMKRFLTLIGVEV